jgi:hypothetical protein
MTRAVRVPARPDHNGLDFEMVEVPWVSSKCQGPRGTPVESKSNYSKTANPLLVNVWVNPCGHKESYGAIRHEAEQRKRKRSSGMCEVAQLKLQ